jgi:hypothetical protein
MNSSTSNTEHPHADQAPAEGASAQPESKEQMIKRLGFEGYWDHLEKIGELSAADHLQLVCERAFPG